SYSARSTCAGPRAVPRAATERWTVAGSVACRTTTERVISVTSLLRYSAASRCRTPRRARRRSVVKVYIRRMLAVSTDIHGGSPTGPVHPDAVAGMIGSALSARTTRGVSSKLREIRNGCRVTEGPLGSVGRPGRAAATGPEPCPGEKPAGRGRELPTGPARFPLARSGTWNYFCYEHTCTELPGGVASPGTDSDSAGRRSHGRRPGLLGAY